MNKFLTVLLTSGNIALLQRALASLPGSADVVVVCNTLNEDYAAELQQSEIAKQYTVLRTPSDGSPGTGKQSVIEYFLSTDYTHLVYFDGDDFLYPSGHDCIVNTVNETDADVVGLQGEDILVPGGLDDWKRFDFQFACDLAGVEGANYIQQCFEFFYDMTKQNDYLFNRLMCVSKKAAEHIKYDNQIGGLDDLKLCCQLKLLHSHDVLKYVLVESTDVYVYDRREQSGAIFDLIKNNSPEYAARVKSVFTDGEINMLRRGVLPLVIVPPNKNKFSRYRHVLGQIKKYI